MSIDSTVANIMKQAVDLDTKERYTEALEYYKEGLQVLDKMRDKSDENNKKYLSDKSEEYLKRVDAIKELIQEKKDEGKYREQVHIEKDSTGNGYKTLFGRFLDDNVEFVLIDDPFIRSFCQCQNLLWLCELLVKSCDKLSRIQLRTCKDAESEANQRDWFYNLKNDLQKYGIQFTVIYYKELFDRQIVLSSGWIIKISRGLDIYKATDNKFCLGVYDLDLRQCHEANMLVVHSNNVKQSNEPNFWSDSKNQLNHSRRRVRAMQQKTRAGGRSGDDDLKLRRAMAP